MTQKAVVAFVRAFIVAYFSKRPKVEAKITRTLEDAPVQWYDFGGESYIVPSPFSGNMAALYCIQNGLLCYKIVYGDFKTEDGLAVIRPALEAAFIKELNAL